MLSLILEAEQGRKGRQISTNGMGDKRGRGEKNIPD